MSGAGGGGGGGSWGPSSSGGKINLSTCKFGWFWANDVEQTPPQAHRNGVKRRFGSVDGVPGSAIGTGFGAYETPIQQRSGSDGDGGTEIPSQDDQTGFGGRNAKRVSFEPSTVGVTGPPPRREQHYYTTPGSPMAAQMNPTGGLFGGANVEEHSTPTRHARETVLAAAEATTTQLRPHAPNGNSVPESPFLLYAQLELSPITPAGGSSALKAARWSARALGPLYPSRSPAPPSAGNTINKGTANLNNAGGADNPAVNAVEVGSLSVVSSQQHPFDMGASHRHPFDVDGGIDGGKSLRDVSLLERQTPGFMGVAGSEGGTRRDGKLAVGNQGPARRRLSSTFNEAFAKPAGKTNGKAPKASAVSDANAARGSAGKFATSSVGGGGDRGDKHVGGSTNGDINKAADEACDDEKQPATDGAAPKTGGGGGSSRKKKSSSGNCKRCNCKKSRCLKLYCECFAAGIYCDGCNCQNCLNTKENAELVAQTRKQIESRNPHAFASKFTQSGGANGEAIPPPPAAADGSTPNAETAFNLAATMRHKKGCHCKKSFCLKKYCECYQAGVFCTDLCKCVNCKNKGEGETGPVTPFQQTNVATDGIKDAAATPEVTFVVGVGGDGTAKKSTDKGAGFNSPDSAAVFNPTPVPLPQPKPIV